MCRQAGMQQRRQTSVRAKPIANMLRIAIWHPLLQGLRFDLEQAATCACGKGDFPSCRLPRAPLALGLGFPEASDRAAAHEALLGFENGLAHPSCLMPCALGLIRLAFCPNRFTHTRCPRRTPAIIAVHKCQRPTPQPIARRIRPWPRLNAKRWNLMW